MDALLLAARVLFVAYFAYSGAMHFVRRLEMRAYVADSGLPLARLAVAVTGALLLAGSAMVAAGIYGDVGAGLLVGFLVPTTLLMHPFWSMKSVGEREENRDAFFRNASFLGGALALLAAFVNGIDLGPTVTEPLWSLGS